MAGHSKWANIKRRKEAQDAKKGARFAQCSRELIQAARMGGGEPEANFRLKTAIDRAKAAGLPNDTIQRAIDKGAGRLDADATEELTYEGYGPGGVAILIETMTNNRNRTAGDIRSYFNKYNGNLGSDGCVAWVFQACGLITLLSNADEDTVMLAAIEAGALDVDYEDEAQQWIVTTEPEALNTVCSNLAQAGWSIQSAEMTRIPQNATELSDPEQIKQLMRLLEAIESHDDVQAVYTNVQWVEA
ncbi:MAG: YebC/PmpR family DNA-binding transcriptional regulator [Vampirovibrionales bacterium]